MAPVAGQKRKVDYNAPDTTAQTRKRQKGKDARTITSQTADAALSTAGELNIASFVKTREFEIAALDQSMKKSRKGLTQRAFQQVPRHMRRRTASHNVKKVPRRLRGRAAKEMKEDNTPTGRARRRGLSVKLRMRLEGAGKLKKLNENRKKARQKKKEDTHNAGQADPEKHLSLTRLPRIKKNKLAEPPRATSKFKRRQINKTWLPTHLWHTKRAHLTRPTVPLWRMAIPLTPTEKCYRPTHRSASARGCIAWDMSYISTIGGRGTELALDAMLNALSFASEGWNGAKYRKWKTGSRFAEGWVGERDKRKRPIAPVLVIWQASSPSTEQSDSAMDVDQPQDPKASSRSDTTKPKLDRRLIIRVHASAFQQTWDELLHVAKMQKPQVLLEDLRFELGSIAIHGPESAEALAGVLKHAGDQEHVEPIWSYLSSIRNPAYLPHNAMLALEVMDPRYNHPPKQLSTARQDQDTDALNAAIISWPIDSQFPTSSIFSHRDRYRISRSLPSQKAVNRRRAATVPGQVVHILEKDPRIPVMLLAHRLQGQGSNVQGSWTLLLPWSCVDIVWRSLMHYPLSSGSTPRFGGLEQTQQVHFEHATPWYPGDFPGLETGKAWDRTESEKRFDTWIRRPPSKRFAWTALDLGLGRKEELGRGWACDWEYLFVDAKKRTQDKAVETTTNTQSSGSTQPRLLTQRQRKAAADRARKEEEEQARRRNTSSPESGVEEEATHNNVRYTHISPQQAAKALKHVSSSASLPQEPALATVRIRLLTRGTPKPAARIYRLPMPLASTSAIPETLQLNGNAAISAQPDAQISGESHVTPLLFDTSSLQSASQSDRSSLRARWLALDQNAASSLTLPRPTSKEHRNHHGDLVARRTYDSKHTKDLSHIRVFPPRETKPQVLNMFGPKPPPKTAEDWQKVLQPQLLPKMIVNTDGKLVEEELWDKHVPCPDAEDLIGFVTTGGYSLSEGGGMAIGSVWVQRVREGWAAEEKAGEASETAHKHSSEVGASRLTQASKKDGKGKSEVGLSKEEAQKAKEVKQKRAQVDRERHLCVVRNAGESVGRLAIWEIC